MIYLPLYKRGQKSPDIFLGLLAFSSECLLLLMHIYIIRSNKRICGILALRTKPYEVREVVYSLCNLVGFSVAVRYIPASLQFLPNTEFDELAGANSARHLVNYILEVTIRFRRCLPVVTSCLYFPTSL